MTLTLAVDTGLTVLVVGVASWTIAVRETFSAVVGFVTYGLLLALVWTRLSAVDVALTEAAIGSGVTGGLLLAAAARLRSTDAAQAAEQPPPSLRVMAGLLSAVVSIGLATIVLILPDPAPTLAPEAVANLAAIGLGNPVTAVLLVYRSWDTLLEKVVLVLALLGVWSLAPDALWGGAPRTALPRATAWRARFSRPGIAPDRNRGGSLHVVDRGGRARRGVSGWNDPGRHVDPRDEGRARGCAAGEPAVAPVRAGGRGAAVPCRRAGGLCDCRGLLAYPVGYAKALIKLIEAPLTFSIAVTLGLLVAGPPERIEPS